MNSSYGVPQSKECDQVPTKEASVHDMTQVNAELNRVGKPTDRGNMETMTQIYKIIAGGNIDS